MPIVECQHCQAQLDAPTEYRGRMVKCSICGKPFVLRFTDHDAPTLSVKVSRREAESAPELKSTVSFNLSDSAKPAPPVEPKAPPPERARRKKPHRES
jgi:hypothetical protein